VVKVAGCSPPETRSRMGNSAAYWSRAPAASPATPGIRARLADGSLQPAATVTVTEDVDIEQQHTETFIMTPSGTPRAAARAEQGLVLRHRDYMASKGIAVRRKRYRPAAGETGADHPVASDKMLLARRRRGPER
jgi:hypothetical protein